MAKILIVEDEVNIRQTLVDILETCSYEVVEAENGLLGSIKAVKENPDLIISDVNMPEMDGYEMLEAIKGCMEDTGMPPFIFLTANAERTDQRRGMILGADDYITKPFKAKELLEAVRIKLKKRAEVENVILTRERLQISVELHDSIQQLLVASFIGFDSLKNKIDKLDPMDQSVYKSALGILKQANNDLRSYAHNIGNVEEIDDIDVRLNEMVDRLRGASNTSFEVDCDLQKSISTKIQGHLFRITQEALSNILKHAKATNTIIQLHCDQSGIKLKVSDNGIGFDTSQYNGMGLNNIKKRTDEIGGDLTLTSQVGTGTTIEVTLDKNELSWL